MNTPVIRRALITGASGAIGARDRASAWHATARM